MRINVPKNDTLGSAVKINDGPTDADARDGRQEPSTSPSRQPARPSDGNLCPADASHHSIRSCLRLPRLDATLEKGKTDCLDPTAAVPLLSPSSAPHGDSGL